MDTKISIIETEDEGWTQRNITYLKELVIDIDESSKMYSTKESRLNILSKSLSLVNIFCTAISAAISYYNQDQKVDSLDIFLSVTTTTSLLCQTSLKVFDIDKNKQKSSVAQMKLTKLNRFIEIQMHNTTDVRMSMNDLLTYIASERDVINLTNIHTLSNTISKN